MENGVHQCQMCGDIFPNFKVMFRHTRVKHALERHFVIRCDIKNCQKSYQNIESYRKHLYIKHRTVMTQSTRPTIGEEVHMEVGDNPVEKVSENSAEMNTLDIAHHVGSLLLKLKEQYHIPEPGLNEVCSEIVFVLEYIRDLSKLEVSQRMNIDTKNLDLQDTDNVIIRTHKLLSTQYTRENYWKTEFGVIMAVEKVFSISESGTKLCIHLIPVDKVLIAYLEHEDVWQDINKPISPNKTHFQDIFDGSFLSSIFEENTIYIQLYADEFEICNPLGAKRGKQKLLAVYFSCLNIHAKYRSKLENIHLALLARQVVVKKYGINAVLKPLFENLKMLENTGIILYGRKFEVAVVVLSGDNLGTHTIGGFSQCFSQGRICRFCMGTKSSINEKFCETHFTMRTPEVHKAHLQAIEKDETNKSIYGVNFKCIFEDLKYFRVTKSLPPDAMHDILEGIVQVLLQQILPKLIMTGIKVEELNERIDNFKYHYTDKSEKPVPLTKFTIKGSASQKWCLFRLLPLFVADTVPIDNEYWELYLIFRKITDIIFAPVIPKSYIPFLHVSIYDFLSSFKILFPDFNMTPKMHFLIHYPGLILQFGPLVRTWAMRFESQHTFFKAAAGNTNSFVNITLTLAKRYQFLQAHQFSSSVLLNLPTITSNASDVKKDSLQDVVIQTLENSLQSAIPEKMSRFSSVTEHCINYKKGGVYCFNFDEGLPHFVYTEEVFLINSLFVLYGTFLVATHFDHHYHTYFVKSVGPVAVKVEQFLDYHALPLYRVSGHLMVNMKYSVFAE